MKPVITQFPLNQAKRLIAGGEYLCQRKSDGQHETVELYAGCDVITVNSEKLIVGKGKSLHRINDLLQINSEDWTKQSTSDRWNALKKFKDCLPLGYELEIELDDVEAAIERGEEGAVFKPLWGIFGQSWGKCKRSENFIVRVSAVGNTQSVGIVDSLSGEARGNVKLGGGKCDCVRVGSIIKVVGFGLTAGGKIREPRIDPMDGETWLVQY